MRKTIEIKITKDLDGLLVKAVLSKKEGLSRREISRLKFNDGILVNNQSARVTQPLQEGDVLTIIFPEMDSIRLGYLPEKPEILYEDEDLILVNKPAGMPCHPSHEHQGDDMGTLLQSYFGKEKFIIRAIGRLDKDVSGVMCYAKNQPSAARLSKQRGQQILHKTYYALALGTFDSQEDTIQYHLQKVEGSKARKVTNKGQLCITNYKVLQQFETYALLEITIPTGRTHQIRAGMASIGHPLVGDSLYGGKSNLLSRPALHCGKLEMKQPFSHQEIVVTCPLAPDMLGRVK